MAMRAGERRPNKALRRFARVRDQSCNRQRLIERDDAVLNVISKRRPLDQLEHERLHTVRFFKA